MKNHNTNLELTTQQIKSIPLKKPDTYSKKSKKSSNQFNKKTRKILNNLDYSHLSETEKIALDESKNKMYCNAFATDKENVIDEKLLKSYEWRKELIEDLFSRFEKFNELTIRLNALCEDFKTEKNLIQKTENYSDAVMENALSYEAGFKVWVSLMHYALTNNTLYYPPNNSLYGQTRDKIEPLVFHVSGVQVVQCFDPNIPLVVKMPLLWSQYNNYITAESGYQFPSHSLAQFRHELEYQIKHLNYKQWPVQRSNQYHFSYINIHRSINSDMIDNDNIDTKTTTDTICDAFFTTDHPLSVSFSYFTKIHKQLPIGSYVIVANGYDDWLSLQDKILILERFFLS